MNENTTVREQPRPFYMVQADLDTRALHRWMGRQAIRDQGHAMHCFLTESLGALAPRPFRATIRSRAHTGSLLAYAQAPAAELEEEIRRYADPLQNQIIIPGSIKSKEVHTEWTEGRALGFEILTRPVVRLERDLSRVNPDRKHGFDDGRFVPGGDCDVYTWESVRCETNGEKIPDREELYTGWLAAKLLRQGGCHADPAEIVIANYRRTRIVHKRDRHGILGPEAIMRGIIKVANQEKFMELLQNGIGRYRPYGYGMVLVKPALPPRRSGVGRPEKSR